MAVSKNQRPQRRALTAALITALLATANAAVAQETINQQEEQEQAGTAEEQQPAAQQEATDVDAVVVTGSHIRRVEYSSISPVQVITADTSVDIGQVETAEFLQKSSVAAGSTQINNQFSGFLVEGGTGVQTVSLRGLGANRTLVLLNGHRPGPAGTRGQVGAFDLNVIPSTILQRAEILKDGASSTYGSDAVAGVVNLITRRDIDRPEITFQSRVPFEGGGESYNLSGAAGFNFGENGNVAVAAEWYLHEPLQVKDRDFFQCSEDLVFDQEGNRIDREDRSIIGGTDLAGCNNLYANTVFDLMTGRRYIPSPDGSTIGLIPGYRPRTNQTYAGGGQAYYEDVLNFDFYGSTQLIDRQERQSVFASADYTFGDIYWSTELLYNHRETDTHRYRQFFPVIGGATSPIPFYRYANDPTYVAPVPGGIAQPVMPFSSDQRIEVDYYFVNTGLDGYFGDSSWSWGADASYSRSEGTYSSLGIVASRSGDVQFDDNAPAVDYFDPGFLSGARMGELEAAIGEWHSGETVYDQLVFSGVASGELFRMPGGAAGAALGVEYRDFSIDDQPSALSRNGDLWGQSSAQVTKGDDNVTEVFGEIELPLVSDQPGFESFNVNASARAFKYESVEDWDKVWKLGAAWQLAPSFQLRATKGTSYRAPGLYELFLGNQTGFLSQLAIDPCINWGESTNQFIRANCGAAGIPEDYIGGGSSATIISGGGAGILKPETSKAFTTGFIITPEGTGLSIALDYFNIEVNDQISQLGGGSILGGCYGSPVYPNAFCNLFSRNAADHPTNPHMITEVRDQYININQQITRGYDLLFRYARDMGIGNLELEGQFTYTMEDVVKLFDPDQASGFASDDLNGSIGRPKVVGNLRTALERGNFTYTWGMDYVHGTKNLNLSPTFTYFGFPGATRDIRAERRLYHTASVRYEQDDWSVVFGIRNLLDETPPEISTGVDSRYGNIPAFATQYDWYGRSAFVNFNYKF